MPSLLRTLPFSLHFSHSASGVSPPGPASSVRILAQHEGMGTLHGPNSQPRYDLATYLHKPRAPTNEACTCACVRARARASAQTACIRARRARTRLQGRICACACARARARMHRQL